MNLDNVRNDINKIDNDMKKLFTDRLQCSLRVAEVKLENNDTVYKPAREKAICESFVDDTKYLTFIKKIIQISRKYQYEIFNAKDALKEEFYNSLDESNKKALTSGGILSLKLTADRESAKGLNAHDILSIIADSALEIKKICASEDMVDVSLVVGTDETSCQEALILAYMLYVETTEGIC
ncbi:MAG: chorismate mutase [Lachnospiraceae bacterium]|nr:chorismate mutase [Lachnospiraceae bacterium]